MPTKSDNPLFVGVEFGSLIPEPPSPPPFTSDNPLFVGVEFGSIGQISSNFAHYLIVIIPYSSGWSLGGCCIHRSI